MEGITLFFSTLWDQLNTVTVPIVELTFTQFLLGIFAVRIAISIFNYLLAKSNSNSDKSKGE